MHPLLINQLQQAGINDFNAAPNADQWARLLDILNNYYQVQENAPLYQSLFEQTHDAVFILDLAGHHVAVNHHASEMLGYKPEEIVALSYRDLVAAEEISQSEHIRDELIAGKYIPPYERRFRHKDGHIIPVEINAELIRESDGTPLYIQSIVRDISGRKWGEALLENSFALYRDLVRSMPNVSLFMVNQDLRYLIAEAPSLARHGYNPHIVGKTLFDVLPPERSRIYEHHYRLVFEHGAESILELQVDDRLYKTAFAPVRDEEGTIIAALAVNEDITVQRSMEELLRYQAALVEQIRDAVYSTDIDQNILTWNPACERLYGWTAAEAIGQFAGNVVGSHLTGEQRAQAVRQIVEQGYWQGEIYHTHRNGTLIPVLVSTIRFDNAAGEARGFVAISRDMTERRQLEDQLRYQATLVEQINDAIFTTDLDMKVVTWNRAAERIYGWTAAEAIGQFYGDLVNSLLTEEERQHGIQQLQQLGYWQEEKRHSKRDGTPLYVHMSSSLRRDVENHPTGYIMICRDITIQKETELALRDAEQRLQIIGQNITDMIIQTDAEGAIQFVTPSVTRLLGYKAEDWIGKPATEYLLQIHPDDIANFVASFGGDMLLPHPIRIEYRQLNTNGEYTHLETLSSPYVDANGVITGRIAVVRDASRRKRAEAALRASEARYRDLFEGIGDSIFVHDLQGNIVDVNEAACRRLGYTREELLRMKTSDIDSPEYAAGFATRLNSQMAHGELDGIRGVHVARDGHEIQLMINSKKIDYRGQPAVMAVARDLTTLMKAEQQALELEAQRHAAETLRRLLGHIAHDLRTPLAVMMTSLYLIRRKYAPLMEDTRNLDTLDHQVSRMTYIVEDVVAFALFEDSQLKLDLRPAQLNQVVQDLLTVQSPLIQAKGHRLDFSPAPDLPLTRLDTAWFIRAFQHLLDNALHFLADAGTITVQTQVANGGVLLELCDSGIGMTAEEMEQIFEPFYRADSARPSSKGGLGLGLAVVAKIIEAHEGNITVNSRPGEGSVFRIWLPVFNQL